MSEDVKVVDTTVNEAEQTAATNEEVKETQEVIDQEVKEESQEVIVESDKVEEEKDKVFTQAQLDEILISRLSKEKIRMLKKLGINEESQIDEVLEKYKNYDSVLSEANTLKKEKEQRAYQDALKELHVDDDFTEFVLQKIDKGENLESFKQNAVQFLEQNPKFKADSFKEVNSSLNLGGREAYPDFSKMTTEQYLAWRAKNKL